MLTIAFFDRSEVPGQPQCLTLEPFISEPNAGVITGRPPTMEAPYAYSLQ